ncbi:hypothetical protein, partial [Paramuribaculum intestinale]|uniref:hypothetical protein n=1 Tax=Paramuribaculum intestinale TaxID=2094151 RepID=UPI0025A5BF5D
CIRDSAEHDFRAFKHVSGNRHPGAAAYTPDTLFTGWIYEHPDRTDTLDLADDSDADFILEDMIMGNDTVTTDSDKKPDVIYMALTPLAWNPIKIIVDKVERVINWPRPSMAWGDRAVDGTFANLDDRMSLALNRVDDETNLHTVTIGSNGDQEVVIDTLQRYCIKFVDVKVPEVDSI